MSVSEQTRSLVWNELFDVARAARYYDGAVKKLTRRRYAVRFLTALGAMGAFTVSIDILPPSLQGFAPIFPLVLMVVLVVDMTTHFDSQVALFTRARHDYNRLEGRWKTLWASTPTADEADVVAGIEELQEAEQMIAAWVGGAQVGTMKRLRNRIDSSTYRALEGQYRVDSETRAIEGQYA